eukprot:4082823-Prymnesium_polylepis.1
MSIAAKILSAAARFASAASTSDGVHLCAGLALSACLTPSMLQSPSPSAGTAKATGSPSFTMTTRCSSSGKLFSRRYSASASSSARKLRAGASPLCSRSKAWWRTSASYAISCIAARVFSISSADATKVAVVVRSFSESARPSHTCGDGVVVSVRVGSSESVSVSAGHVATPQRACAAQLRSRGPPACAAPRAPI